MNMYISVWIVAAFVDNRYVCILCVYVTYAYKVVVYCKNKI